MFQSSSATKSSKNLMYLTKIQQDLLLSGLSELGLSVRTQNQLESVGVFTVENLLMLTREQLMDVPNIGAKTVEDIFKALEEFGFHRTKK